MSPRSDRQRRLRILHIVRNLHYGGLERMLADLIRLSDHARHEVHVLALQYLGVFADGLDTVAALHTAPRLPKWTMLWPRPLTRQVCAIAPDIVHTHTGVWYKGSLAARQAGVPVLVHTEHGRRRPDPWDMRLVDGLASRRTDAVVAVSDSLSDQLAKHVVARGTRIEVIINGVDTERFRPRARSDIVRAEHGIALDAPIIGSIGRLEHIKGYDVMVHAFGRLLSQWSTGPAPVLLLCGEGSLRPELERLVASYGIGHAVHFLGWRNDIETLHATFDLFSLGSRSEGTSIGLLEAMSAGLCPVVTDVGGNPVVLGANLRHRMVPAESVEALAAAWRDALSDGDRRQRDGVLARERVEAHFGVQRMVQAYAALYEDLAGVRATIPGVAPPPLRSSISQ